MLGQVSKVPFLQKDWGAGSPWDSPDGLEESELTQSLLTTEDDLQKDLHRAFRLEEEYWRQKSRSLWMLDGDKNMSYFHKQAEARKHFKAVNEIQHQEQMIKDFEGIKKATHSFYKDLYTAPEENPTDVLSYPFDHIPQLVSE